MKTKIFKAFTLIELLIVIVIIGILATALIPRVTGVQNKARYARVEKDFRDFRIAVLMAQNNTNKPLKDITNNNCSGCYCGFVGSSGLWIFPGIDFRQMTNDSACRMNWVSALRKIEIAAGMDTGALSSMDSDPRGSPYYLDENEMEGGGCNSPDRLKTVGSDGYDWGSNSTMINDDKIISIAQQGCPGSY